MASTTLFRLSGLALLVALALQVVGSILHPPTEDVVDVLKPTYAPAHLTMFLAWLLAVLGLPGLYARQAQRAGVLGLVGFVLSMAVAAYHFYLLLYEATATPLLAQDPGTQVLIGPGGRMTHGAGALGPLSFALLLGWPVFGLATVRAGVLPRWAGWLQVLAFPASIVGMAIFILVPDALAQFPTQALQPVGLVYDLVFLGYAWGGYALWRESAAVPGPAARSVAPQPVA
jgi:hypothetical protein